MWGKCTSFAKSALLIAEFSIQQSRPLDPTIIVHGQQMKQNTICKYRGTLVRFCIFFCLYSKCIYPCKIKFDFKFFLSHWFGLDVFSVVGWFLQNGNSHTFFVKSSNTKCNDDVAPSVIKWRNSKKSTLGHCENCLVKPFTVYNVSVFEFMSSPYIFSGRLNQSKIFKLIDRQQREWINCFVGSLKLG